MIVLNEQGTPQLNTVHHCRAEALLSALDTASVDLVVTSPPYDNLRTYNGFSWNFEYIAQQSYRVLKPGGVLVWVVGDATVNGSESLSSFKQAIYFVEGAGFKLHDTMIYHKNANVMNVHHPRYLDGFEYMLILSKGVPKTFNELTKKNVTTGQMSGAGKRQRNGKVQMFGNERQPTGEYSRRDNVWRYFSGGGHADSFASEHPATFPEDLARDHIESWSNVGDTVLDFFGGSGTTAREAQKMHRQWMTNDISREYCDLMERRLAQPYTPSFLPQLETA